MKDRLKELLKQYGCGPIQFSGTNDAGLAGQRLERFRVIFADCRVDDAPGHQVHPLDVVAFRERAGQVHDVQRLAAGVGIPAEFEIMAPDEAVNADEE